MERVLKEEIETTFGQTKPVEIVENEMYLVKKAQIDKLQFHSAKKYVLGDRIVVLRKLVMVLHWGKVTSIGHSAYFKRVESYLDRYLIKEEYNLEKCIDLLRKRVSVLW